MYRPMARQKAVSILPLIIPVARAVFELKLRKAKQGVYFRSPLHFNSSQEPFNSLTNYPFSAAVTCSILALSSYFSTLLKINK
jgi:hypothetical protein